MSDRLTEAELLDLAAWMRHLRETWPRDVCEAPLAYVQIATVEAMICEVGRLRTEIIRYMRLNAEQVDLLAALTSHVASSSPREGMVVLEVKREDWERAKAASGS